MSSRELEGLVADTSAAGALRAVARRGRFGTGARRRRLYEVWDVEGPSFREASSAACVLLRLRACVNDEELDLL
jgi:hypothetical protein